MVQVESAKERELTNDLMYSKIKWPKSLWLREVNPKNFTCRIIVPAKWVEEERLKEREKAAPVLIKDFEQLEAFNQTAKREMQKGNPIVAYIFEGVKPKR